MTRESSELKRREYAATLMIEALPKQARDLSIDICDLQLHCPRWHFVVGHLLKAFESGSMMDFATEPYWDTEILEGEPSTCEFCGEQFDPVRLGQKFCSNECGQKFNLGLKKEDTLDGPDDPADISSTVSSDDNNDPGHVVPTLDELLRESAEVAYREIT